MKGNRSMPPEHKRNPALLIGIGISAALLGGYLGVCAWVGQADQVMPNVSVSGVDVGGLSRQQTSQQLSSVQEDLVNQMIDEIVEQIFNATVANW